MDSILIALIGAALAAVQAATNLPQATNAVAPDPNGPTEKQFKKIMEDDDAAHEEVDQWIKENREFAAKGAAEPSSDMNRRIMKRFDIVRKSYEDFIKQHPNYAHARVAFAAFLGELGEEEEEQTQLEKALELDKKDPAIYNNLANVYGHIGPVTNAFAYYAKAIELNPAEPVYYHNFGTTVYLFRRDAMEYYGISEQQVFDKALELYAKSMKHDPTNFLLASDIAQTYYGIKPPRTEDALRSWTNALQLAHDEVEREGVYLHLARVKLHAGRFEQANAHLNNVTNEMYAQLKARLARSLEYEREQQRSPTNASPPADAPKKQPE